MRISKWQYGERHYIMDMMNTDPCEDWQAIQDQEDVTDSMLRTNVPASMIVPNSYWIHERIKRTDCYVRFLTISGEHLWMLEGYVQHLVESHPQAFNSRQLASIKYWVNPEVIEGVIQAPSLGCQMSTLVPDKQMDRKNVSLYPVVNGPSLSDVQWLRGAGSIKESYPFGNVYYDIMTERVLPAVVSQIVPPIEVQRAWQNFYFKPVPIDLLDVDYYMENSLNYSSWSFGLHTKQVASVLSSVPKFYRLVAPGDGWGVVKKMASHRVYSTDIVHGVDATETFTETFFKLQPGDVLVLSYLWSLLDPADQALVLGWEGPIVLIDSQPRIMGFTTVGQGVFSRNCDEWFSGMITPEGYHEQSVLYTENLLRIEEVSTQVQTSAYLYLITHRPLIPRTLNGVIVCSNLAEALKVGIARTPYLAPIGKRWDKVVPAVCELGVKWQTRTVYSLPKESPYVKFIQKWSYWGMDTEFFYFCFSFVTNVRFALSSRSKVHNFSISVLDEDTWNRSYPYLLEVTPTDFVWATSRGHVKWKRTQLSCALLWHVLDENVGSSARGWKRATGVLKQPVLDQVDQYLFDYIVDLPDFINCSWLDSQDVRLRSNGKTYQFDYRDTIDQSIFAQQPGLCSMSMRRLLNKMRMSWFEWGKEVIMECHDFQSFFLCRCVEAFEF